MLWNIAAVPLNIDWQQILLHLLNFVILFAGLYLLLYKPVKAFMKKRSEHYEKMQKDAEEKNAAADRARTEYEGKLASVDREIEEKRAAAKKELDGYEAMRKNAAEEEAESILRGGREHPCGGAQEGRRGKAARPALGKAGNFRARLGRDGKARPEGDRTRGIRSVP